MHSAPQDREEDCERSNKIPKNHCEIIAGLGDVLGSLRAFFWQPFQRACGCGGGLQLFHSDSFVDLLVAITRFLKVYDHLSLSNCQFLCFLHSSSYPSENGSDVMAQYTVVP